MCMANDTAHKSKPYFLCIDLLPSGQIFILLVPEMPWSRALWWPFSDAGCYFCFSLKSLLSFLRHGAEFCHASQPEANKQKETRSQPLSLQLILESQWQQSQHKGHNITDIFCVVLIAMTGYWGKKQPGCSTCPSLNTIWMQTRTQTLRC